MSEMDRAINRGNCCCFVLPVAVAVFNEQCLALGKSCMSNIRRQMQNARFHLQRRINCRIDMVSNLVTYTAHRLLSGG